MTWQIIVALVVAIPIIVLPVALIWYLNIKGLVKVMSESRAHTVEVAELEGVER